ncbi:hypothetical protein IT570_00680 [Candidatus Sumerlaeota bacterium]|nr:hypothetical protein [Candidatus Sumerlaeota bacterium]
MADIIPSNPDAVSESLAQFASGLTTYLDYLGVPSEAVLVEQSERRKVINNLPDVVALLNDEQKQSAMYLSKFVAACGIGLFDAALNYLWDETVRSIRDKVTRFDLDYFFSTVVTDPARRSKLRTPEDLAKIEDWELIKGSMEAGIITDIGYRHLDYIRSMRNHASAAHPNQNDLSGLQLVSWLETCVKEVLAKDPVGPALEVRRLLKNIRENTFSSSDTPAIIEAIKLLPDELLISLSRAIAGMYGDPSLDAHVRNNIKLIAAGLWGAAPDDAKYEAGLKQATLAANGDVARAKLIREFLDLVDGLSFLPAETLAVEIGTAVDSLYSAHQGWSNFSREVAPARALSRLIPANGAVPHSVEAKYVKVLTLCRIGNGYGVSNAAVPFYDELISKWQDRHIRIFTRLPYDREFLSRLQSTSCGQEYAALATRIKTQAVNTEINRGLDKIISFPPNAMGRLGTDSEYQRIVKR